MFRLGIGNIATR